MAKRKEINNEVLLKIIKENTNQSEIMERFGFKTSTQLKVAYANALMESGIAPEIIKGKPKNSKPVNTKISINSRGSIVIPKALVEALEIKEGQMFEVKKTGSGLQLKNVEKTDIHLSGN